MECLIKKDTQKSENNFCTRIIFLQIQKVSRDRSLSASLSAMKVRKLGKRLWHEKDSDMRLKAFVYHTYTIHIYTQYIYM